VSQSFRSDLALLGLAVVGVLSDLACVLTGHVPPGLFSDVTLAGLTGAAGVALPLRAASNSAAAGSTQTPSPDAVSAPMVQQSPAAVAPQPYTGPVGQ
jgi:hypothetical protein